MDLQSRIMFINNFLTNKEDLEVSIEKYIEHCSLTTEEGWTEEKREVIVELLYEFLVYIRRMRLPKIKEPNWYFDYCWTQDGIRLELLYCENIEFDEKGNISSMDISDTIPLAEVKCNYLSVEEYAEKYHVTVTAVRQWIRRGKLRTARKMGRDWIIPELADRPKRGYEPVTYRWNKEIKNLILEFPYLGECRAIHLMQAKEKSKFEVVMLDQHDHCLQKRLIDVKEREKLELALISENQVEMNEWSAGIQYVPDLDKKYYIKGERIMEEALYMQYSEKMKLLQREDLELNIVNAFTNWEGMHVWNVSLSLVKNIYDDTCDCEQKELVKVNSAVIIPPEIDFTFEESENSFLSGEDFCDSISEDIYFTYLAISEGEVGIRPEIIRECNLNEEDAYESSILYIGDIQAETMGGLKMFLNLFDVFMEGIPQQNCKLAVVLMNWETENEKAKIFLECGWKIRNLDTKAVVAYRKI